MNINAGDLKEAKAWLDGEKWSIDDEKCKLCSTYDFSRVEIVDIYGYRIALTGGNGKKDDDFRNNGID